MISNKHVRKICYHPEFFKPDGLSTFEELCINSKDRGNRTYILEGIYYSPN